MDDFRFAESIARGAIDPATKIGDFLSDLALELLALDTALACVAAAGFDLAILTLDRAWYGCCCIQNSNRPSR
jgi:hypothetical protein